MTDTLTVAPTPAPTPAPAPAPAPAPERDGGRVLVTGASGSVGRAVLAALRDAGVPVRALSRNPATVDAWRSEGVDAATGALDDLAGALEGCERMFLLSAATPDQYVDDRAAVDAARAAGITHVVKLSSGDAVPDSPIAWARAHAYSDRYLQASGMGWTLLKPSAFYPNLLANAPTISRGFLPHTSKAGTTGWIDVADIAASAASVLTGDGHVGATYVLTGPEALSFPDLALRLSSVLARPVRPVFVPAPLYRTLLRAAGTDAWSASNLVAQFADVVRSGRHDPGVTTTVADLTGRAPVPVTDWIWQHRQDFA